jgi:hypothetical protein
VKPEHHAAREAQIIVRACRAGETHSISISSCTVTYSIQ